MKIELQAGDTITIPEGCKATIKDRNVIFEKAEDFKDGDILVPIVNGQRSNAFIYKSTDKNGYHSFYAGLNTLSKIVVAKYTYNRWCKDKLVCATEEEKQLLFDKMKEQGLKWNAEEKRVEKIRWRAKYGDEYWYVTSSCSVAGDFMREENSLTGAGAIEDWSGYNHFRKKAQAAEAAKRMKETLRKYHEEIGE